MRSLATGKVLFAVASEQCGVILPQDGPFEMMLELQFNVPPGVYGVETAVWDRATQRDIARGPSVTLQIAEGMRFYGSVQMHPQMQLVSAPLAGARTAS